MRFIFDEMGVNMELDNSKDRIEKFRSWYIQSRSYYKKVVDYVLTRILLYLEEQKVNIAYSNSRVKSVDSAYEKAKKQIKDGDKYKPKYSDPKNQITDLAGVRVVVYLPSEVEAVSNAVERLFVNQISRYDSENKIERLGKDKKKVSVYSK